eukprot:gene9998-18625_t
MPVADVANPVSNSESMSRQEVMEHFSSVESSLERILGVFPPCSKGQKLLLGMLRRLLCPLKPHVLRNLGIYCKVIRVAVPQSTMGGSQALHVAISSILPPVPSYLVDRIKLGHFVDFTLLRPCNLKHSPVAEPSPVHLAKLAKSELQPICTFQDWSEAWAVHGAIIAQKCPDKVANHYSYFLLLTSAHRDIPGMGWLVYDVAFRKHAAEKDFDIWRVVMPTLWMTREELSAGSMAGPFSSYLYRTCTLIDSGYVTTLLLSHCAKKAMPFLHRLIDRSCLVDELHLHVPPSLWEREDIAWWIELMNPWNGRSLFYFPTWERVPDTSISSDTAGAVGFAAINRQSWLAAEWPPGTENLSIVVKELLPIVPAAHIWGNSWSPARIVLM